MNHLLIGAAQATHVRDYACSWERATATRPFILSWAELAVPAALPELPPGPLLLRLASPTEGERAILASLGGAGVGIADVEAAPAVVAGLIQATALLESHLSRYGAVPCYATPPQTLVALLDLELRHRCLSRDGVPAPGVWPIDSRGARLAYEAVRNQLRLSQGGRLILRLRRSLPPVPTVELWLSGRGLRGRANCRFTPAGAARCPVHTMNEAELRPLVGRLGELGAVVEEAWTPAEIAGRPFVLSLLCAGGRILMGQVGPGSLWRVRGAPPEPGVPQDFSAMRRHVPRELLSRIEEATARLCRSQRCVGLVVDVALSRRFDDFRVLDIDPFAELPGDLRDAVGWSAFDHLVRRVRTIPQQEAQPAASR
ncbi:MAG: hypothetical protein RMK29_20465 [Myxococcales bacterium]|nr:hypothetical protein [Myxococcota bacterium]MDW8284085.1 hypothetical protein [Myxococcales bacterium]